MQSISSGAREGATTIIHSPVWISGLRDFKLHIRYPDEGRMERFTSETFVHVPSI